MNEFFKVSPFFEQGCILGKTKDVVNRVFFDEGNKKEGEYEPNIELLNKALENWFGDGIEFVGMAHSHPNGLLLMSDNDEHYMRELRNSNDMNKLYFLIVSYDENGDFLIKVHSLSNDDQKILEEGLVII